MVKSYVNQINWSQTIKKLCASSSGTIKYKKLSNMEKKTNKINFSQSKFDREILLTPKHSLQVNGKIIYFKPLLQNQNITKEVKGQIPWEQALKHVTFLTLNNHLDDSIDLNDLPEYKKFMNANYISSDLYIPKFGDIITLAKGRLESNFSNGTVTFIEGLCNEKCDPKNTLAFWQVEKIRHRDSDKNFRYEIRLTVNTKTKNDNIDDNRRSIENDSAQSESRQTEQLQEQQERLQRQKQHQQRPSIRNTNVKRSQRTPRILRSFILKDNDYPNSFSFLNEHLLRRHNTATRTAYLDKLNSFNDVFTQPRYFHTTKFGNDNDYSNLNIGEYIIPTRTSYPIKENFENPSRLGQTINPYITTTFRPNFNQKFPIPNNFPFPYHFENKNNYPSLNREPISQILPQYEVPPNPNPQITVHTHKPFDITGKPIEVHSHHHYYDPNFNNQRDILKGEHYSSEAASAPPPPYFQEHQSTISLIEQPLTSGGIRSHYNYRTPPTITNQIPVPPSQSPTHYNLDTTYPGSPPPISYNPTQSSNYASFHQYEQKPEYEKDNSKHTYSSPDPIYHPESVSNSFEDSTKYNQPKETASKNSPANYELFDQQYYYRKPDSINAQLPPPAKGQDIVIPYIDNLSPQTSTQETSERTTFNKNTQEIFVTPPPKTLDITTILPKVTSPLQNKSRTTTKRLKSTKQESRNSMTITPSRASKSTRERSKLKSNRSTTERPVLKWKSKRGKITREYPRSKSRKNNTTTTSKYEFEKVYVDDKTATVTPSKTTDSTINNKSKDISTKKSIATSITYKVGRDKLQKPFKPTLKIPNVEIVEANLVKLPTPHHKEIKLFKATENLNEKLEKNSKDEIELTETIVNHARNL